MESANDNKQRSIGLGQTVGQDESQRTIAKQAKRIEQLEQALRDIRDGKDAPCSIVNRALWS